ncbi:MAG: sigma-70 family RNA polymerase sigma factor [Planctomycetes bacterium]|nr:sigma-70 family RNA polymerase sigma factor [Planctomycetota bacterium]
MPPVAATPKTPRMTTPAFDLGALVRRHQLGLWRYARALGVPAADAEDLLQDTFVVALRRLDADRGEAAVATFLRQTCKHLWLRRRRDQSRREQLLLEHADAVWTRECDDDDGERWQAALRACVGGLDGRAREVVERFYGDGLPRDQVADRLGMKETGVKTLLQRVRALLRDCIERRLRGDV